MITRRQFIVGSIAFSGLAASAFGKNTSFTNMRTANIYGALVPDSNGLLDLPEGFSYTVISEFGQVMSDGLHVPDRADGMGCLPIDNAKNKVALIRNHELHPKHIELQPLSIQSHVNELAYDTYPNGIALQGTTTLIYNTETKRSSVSLLVWREPFAIVQVVLRLGERG